MPRAMWLMRVSRTVALGTWRKSLVSRECRILTCGPLLVERVRVVSARPGRRTPGAGLAGRAVIQASSRDSRNRPVTLTSSAATELTYSSSLALRAVSNRARVLGVSSLA